jgi:hypothetical protein
MDSIRRSMNYPNCSLICQHISPKPSEDEHLKFEVFDLEGVLLQSFPLDHYGDGIEICGDRFYILDKVRHMKVHIY